MADEHAPNAKVKTNQAKATKYVFMSSTILSRSPLTLSFRVAPASADEVIDPVEDDDSLARQIAKL